jgi:hypothetical protein
MQIRRRKGIQNHSPMPPDPKVEREEKGINVKNQTSIIAMP